jgi:hypothetical protein
VTLAESLVASLLAVMAGGGEGCGVEGAPLL